MDSSWTLKVLVSCFVVNDFYVTSLEKNATVSIERCEDDV